MVHVHIATELLEALRPGVTGLCFIIRVWLVILIGLPNSLSTSTFSEMIKRKMCMYSCLTSHTLHREEGSGHAATIKFVPWQKLDVTRPTLFVGRIRCHGVQLCRVKQTSASFLTAVFDNCISRQQLNG